MKKNILETIVEYKTKEVEAAKSAVPVEQLKQSEYYSRETLSLRQFLADESRTGIIAEFKRKSPSKGVINADALPEVVTTAYTDGGASGLSVLTDQAFFGGNNTDLIRARRNLIPILRKDFIIDEYQIIEAKAIGADVILLIAACLTPPRVKSLAGFARSLGLEVLLEIHDESELAHICDEVDLVGINNRNLKTFEVNLERSIDLGCKIADDKIKIAESGISEVSAIILLKKHGFKGFLIGEAFMKERDPVIAFARFVHQLKTGVT